MNKSIIVACALAVAGPASAHAFLESALPRVGSTVAAPPADVQLTFSQAIEPDFSRLQVQDASGASVAAGAAHAATDDATKFAVPVKKLAPGKYTVIWHVTSADTHKSQGKFSFSVGQ